MAGEVGKDYYVDVFTIHAKMDREQVGTQWIYCAVLSVLQFNLKSGVKCYCLKVFLWGVSLLLFNETDDTNMSMTF